MSKKSVWITGFTSSNATQPVFEYLSAQANDLSEQTDGKVKAECTLATDFQTLFTQSVSALSAMSSQLGRSTVHSKAKDASGLYEMTSYDFYLFDKDHNYEFILFQLRCNDVFPIQVTIDQTVAEEIGRGDKLQVDTYSAFTNLFERMVQSNKVIYIIERLLQMPSITDAEQIPGIKEVEDDTNGNDQA